MPRTRRGRRRTHWKVSRPHGVDTLCGVTTVRKDRTRLTRERGEVDCRRCLRELEWQEQGDFAKWPTSYPASAMKAVRKRNR